MGWSFWLKLIVTLLTFALAAIEFDFFKKFEKDKIKKRWIGFLFVALILFTISDTTKESIDSSKESAERDLLIKEDSLRFDKILTNFENNINGITKTTKEITIVDSILRGVKDTLEGQVVLLNEVISKSKELVQLETKKFELERPKIILKGANTKIVIDSLGNFKEFQFQFINVGKRVAENAKLHTRCLYYNVLSNSLSFVDSDYAEEEGYYDITDIVPSGSANLATTITIYPKINIERFKLNFNRIIFVFSLQFKDLYTGNYEETFFYSGSGFNNGDFEISQNLDANSINRIKSFYKANGLSEYLFLK